MSKRIVVITGASSGIGAATAELLGKRGDAVVLVARRKNALEAVASRCGEQTLAAPADMTVRQDVERVVADTLARFGQIDVWINNAGQGISRMPSELTDEDVDFVMRANVKSALYGMQAVLPHFKTRGTGHVINISSLLGRVPFAVIRSAYSGSKHFLNALTAMFRAEVQQAHPGIQFSVVSPGVVRTDFGLNALHGGPDSRSFPDSQSAEEVAAVIVRAVDTRLPDVYTKANAKAQIAGYYAELGVGPDLV